MFHFVTLPKIRMMLPQVIACAEGAVHHRNLRIRSPTELQNIRRSKPASSLDHPVGTGEQHGRRYGITSTIFRSTSAS
jgi:hypothetical protein